MWEVGEWAFGSAPLDPASFIAGRLSTEYQPGLAPSPSALWLEAEGMDGGETAKHEDQPSCASLQLACQALGVGWAFLPRMAGARRAQDKAFQAAAATFRTWASLQEDCFNDLTGLQKSAVSYWRLARPDGGRTWASIVWAHPCLVFGVKAGVPE